MPISFEHYKLQIQENGFCLIDGIFSNEEVEALNKCIETANSENPAFRKTEELFAIRRVLKEIPSLYTLVFNRLSLVIEQLFGNAYFITKSIYFDKPAKSNWFVPYHQDLTISVKEKKEVPGFGPWTLKHHQYAVQPPISILENNFTIRIHLDNTTISNGALKVVDKSHSKGLYRPETINWAVEKESVCEVKKGGIMIMRPLLLHSSSRTTDNNRRRVLHIEFGKDDLPSGLKWSEYFDYKPAMIN